MSNPITQPPVPNPESTKEEVRNYLIAFFRRTYDEEGAALMADKVVWDGEILYSQDEKRMKEIWPESGSLIYNRVQNSMYGRVCSNTLLTIPYMVY